MLDFFVSSFINNSTFENETTYHNYRHGPLKSLWDMGPMCYVTGIIVEFFIPAT